MIRSKSLIVIINFIMLSSMVLGLIAPVAELGIRAVSAQESTQEPDAAAVEATEPVEPTAAPTSVPTEVPPTATDVPQVAPPAAEATEEPADESTQPVVVETTEAVQPEATEEPEITAEPTSDAESTIEPTAEQTQEATTEPTETAAPTLDPALTTFADDFEDGDTIGWTLSPGWALTTSASGDNLLLRGVMPDSTAAINELDWPQLNLKARVRVQPGSTLEIAVRQQEDDGYRVTLDATGLTALYRGDTLLAQGAAIDPEITAAVWRTIVVQALGGNVIVALDDSVQFTYEDPTSLGAGSVTFKTGADNSGAVDVDDVVITKLEASVLPDESVTATEPAPEITETVMPEVTEEATAEVEATEEAEATQEAESTQEPEATEEPVSIPLVAVPVLSADFEGELDGWFASDGAVVVAVDETNQALLMSGGDTLLPASEIVLNDFRLDTRIQFLSAASGGLSLVFHSSDGSSYVLAFEAAQTVLYRSDGGSLNPLAVTEAAREAGVWYALSLEAVGGQITLTVNDAEELMFTDEAPLTGGALALAATGDSSFFLDDLALYDLVPQDQLVTPTPLPTNVLTEENGAKLSFRLYQVLQLVEVGDLEGARSLAAESNVQILDDALNVDVTVWPVGDIDLLTPLVEMNGGVILPAQDATHLNVRIPLTGLVAVISAEEVQNVLLPDVAASTSSDFEAALAPANLDPNLLHSLSIIGWNDWNLNSITGSGVKVAVIDKAGNHRNAVIEVIETIAPGTLNKVTPYT
ncbi:MAG: hypothetical protein K8J31_30705, partial [Anaerolineae bacterium]|nr:hypothetical protein [Anaerolineae bacterium]